MYIPINFLGTKLSSDTLTTVDYLIVAGGGGGGYLGGGGGAGGLISGSINTVNLPNAELTASIVVGAGGVGGLFNSGALSQGGNGANSYIYVTSSIVATGGGGGGTFYVGFQNGKNGGSGGGAYIPSGLPKDSCLGTPGLGTSGQGNRGGYGWSKLSSNATGSGGGGGASQVGGCGYETREYSFAGIGGSGSQWFDGEFYAGGGGAVTTTFGGQGGIGGGGTGNPSGVGYSGSRATGGGGGAGWSAGAPGGSGMIIFRYYGTEVRGYGGDVETIGDYTYHKFRNVATSSFQFSAYTQNDSNPLDYCNGVKFLAGPDGGIASYRLCNATASVTQSLSGSEYALKCVDTDYSYSVSGVNSQILYMDGCGEYRCNYVTFTAGSSGGVATYVRCGSTAVTQSLIASQSFSTCVEYGEPIDLTGIGSKITYSGSCFF
jgi:hypothetical protein